MRCVTKALGDDKSRENVLTQLAHGVLDLLSLPTYGRYQHTYEEMLAAQDELIASAGDRVTVLHLGRDLDDELTDLYLALAGSTTPLGEDHLRDLKTLAERCAPAPSRSRSRSGRTGRSSTRPVSLSARTSSWTPSLMCFGWPARCRAAT